VYDAFVRTSFSPDPDVETKIKALVRTSSKSMNRVINDLLRQALAGQVAPVEVKRYQVKPFPLGLKAGIDPLRLNQLVDEVEDEDKLREMMLDRDHS
jgi:hypothetical protein